MLHGLVNCDGKNFSSDDITHDPSATTPTAVILYTKQTAAKQLIMANSIKKQQDRKSNKRSKAQAAEDRTRIPGHHGKSSGRFAKAGTVYSMAPIHDIDGDDAGEDDSPGGRNIASSDESMDEDLPCSVRSRKRANGGDRGAVGPCTLYAFDFEKLGAALTLRILSLLDVVTLASVICVCRNLRTAGAEATELVIAAERVASGLDRIGLTEFPSVARCPGANPCHSHSRVDSSPNMDVASDDEEVNDPDADLTEACVYAAYMGPGCKPWMQTLPSSMFNQVARNQSPSPGGATLHRDGRGGDVPFRGPAGVHPQ